MAKRFTDTEKWRDPWFCSLTETERNFWSFLLDTCTLAGIWQVNWPLVKFYLPYFEFDESKFKDRIKIINPEKWFISKFVKFQYGELHPNNPLHKRVISELVKEGVYIPLESPLQGAQDMVVSSSSPLPSSSLSSLGRSGNPFLIPDDLKDSEPEIKDWLEYKKQKGQTYKSKGLEALWRAFRKIPVNRRREAVDSCMASNYTGLHYNGGNSGLKNNSQTGDDSPGKYEGIVQKVSV